MNTNEHLYSGACRLRILVGILCIWASALGLVAQVAEVPHCHGVVQKIVQPDGVVTYQLICQGECPDGGNCEPRQSQNQHGGVREWCGCGEEEPPHCHIVLYTPGPGEGGGQPQVFCAGQCQDGQPCRLREQLIHEVDGIQVFHLFCACEDGQGHGENQTEDDRPGSDQPNDPGQDTPDAAVPAPEIDPEDRADAEDSHCQGIVQKVVLRDGRVTYQLICEGKCDDGPCAPRRSQNGHGGVREWCGCGDAEPSHCHIVLYTLGQGEGGGGQEVFCAGNCPNGDRCFLREVLVADVDGNKVYHLMCACAGGGPQLDDDAGDRDNPGNSGTDEDPKIGDDTPSNGTPAESGGSQDNGDDCCDDAGKTPCKGVVQKVVLPDGRTTYQLICEGECPDSKCLVRSATNHHGGVREWCGCERAEGTGCHIVLYTPGPGEAGGVRVFCAGSCADGTPCKLKSALFAKTSDGTLVYRLSCNCEPPSGNMQPTVPEDPTDATDADEEDDSVPGQSENPGDNKPSPEEPDQGNPQVGADDPNCCGDKDAVKKPCRGYVQKVVQNNGIVTYQVACEGECPDSQCEKHRSVNHHGGVREWCGCEGDEEPTHCHVVLYTPGPGEGGGSKRAFCAGRCDDGTACKLTETLVMEVDGTKVYRLTCDCDRPGGGSGSDSNDGNDDQPNGPTDPNTPQDPADETGEDASQGGSQDGNDSAADACCGDDAGGKPCKGYVQKIVQNNGRVTYQLICGGDCPDRAKCEPRSSRNHHGGVRQWCGCNDREPSNCHIVLYTPGEGEGGGAQRVFCAGSCPDGAPCKIKTVLVHRTADGNEVYHITCDCDRPAAGGGGNIPNNGDDNRDLSETPTIPQVPAGPDNRDTPSDDGEQNEPYDNEASRTELDNEERKLRIDNTISMRLRMETVPFRGEKFYQLTFDGVPESLYEVLVSDNMLDWQSRGFAEETGPGQYGWIDDFVMDRRPRFYKLVPLYADRDLNE